MTRFETKLFATLLVAVPAILGACWVDALVLWPITMAIGVSLLIAAWLGPVAGLITAIVLGARLISS